MNLQRIALMWIISLSFLFTPLFAQIPNYKYYDYEEVDLYLTCPNPSYQDQVRVRLNEWTTNGFDPGLDAVKMLSPVMDVPQFYTRMTVAGEGTYNFAVNSLPRNPSGITKIAMGMRFGLQGQYTIRINLPEKAANCTQILLIDSISPTNVTITDFKTASEYTFTSTATAGTTTTTRFKLRIYSEIPTHAHIIADRGEISCTNPTDTLRAITNVNGTYLWSTGETTPYIVVDQPGNYSLTVTNTATGQTGSESITIGSTVSLPSVSISSSADALTCGVSAVTLTAAGSGVNYLWSTGETSSSITVSEAGEYTVTATNPVTACSSSASKTIGENKTIPSVGISAANTELTCAVTSINLTTEASGVTYLWSTGETADVIAVTEPGTYTLTVTDVVNGCSNTASEVITQDITAPIVSIASSGDEINSYTLSIDLDAVTNSQVSYLWSTGETTWGIQVTTPGTYSVTVTDNYNGCSAFASKTIRQGISIHAAASNVYFTGLVGLATVNVYNVQNNKLAYTFNNVANNQQLNINKPATYIFQVQTATQTASFTVVITKK